MAINRCAMKQTTELELASSDAVEVRRPESPRELMMLAIQGNADVAILERLEAMQERYDKKRAKQAYDEALAAFQAECPVILKSVDGAQRKYRFAPMDHILQIVQPLLKKHGFSWSVTNPVREGWVKCIITVKHSAGHAETSEFEVPIDSRNNLMSAAQAYGGARTFCLRYAFLGALGILTADEDHDGQTARSKLPAWMQDRMDAQTKPADGNQPRPITEPALASEVLKAAKVKLWIALKDVRGTDKTWDVAETWMRSKKIIGPGDKVNAMSAQELEEAWEKTTIELNP